jgi:hypothetical protein
MTKFSPLTFSIPQHDDPFNLTVFPHVFEAFSLSLSLSLSLSIYLSLSLKSISLSLTKEKLFIQAQTTPLPQTQLCSFS